MKPFVVRRLLSLLPVLFLVPVITFTLTLLLPGDPALAYIGEESINDKVMYQTVRQELGLDQPIPVQYVKWLARALHGDFGRSIRTHEPALDGLLARLPVLPGISKLIQLVDHDENGEGQHAAEQGRHVGYPPVEPSCR